jgi:hypothetical protein
MDKMIFDYATSKLNNMRNYLEQTCKTWRWLSVMKADKTCDNKLGTKYFSHTQELLMR